MAKKLKGKYSKILENLNQYLNTAIQIAFLILMYALIEMYGAKGFLIWLSIGLMLAIPYFYFKKGLWSGMVELAKEMSGYNERQKEAARDKKKGH